MEYQFPEVEQLFKLANENPEELERLRQNLSRQLIDNAPKHYQKRLKGLQFQIDMEKKRCKNKLHTCIKLSEMMLDSFTELQNSLNNLNHEPIVKQSAKSVVVADIIEFPKLGEKSIC